MIDVTTSPFESICSRSFTVLTVDNIAALANKGIKPGIQVFKTTHGRAFLVNRIADKINVLLDKPEFGVFSLVSWDIKQEKKNFSCKEFKLPSDHTETDVRRLLME